MDMSSRKAEAQGRDLGWLLWAGLPALAVVLCLLAPLAGAERWHALVLSEQTGFIENSTVVLLVAALVVCGGLMARRQLPAISRVLLVLVFVCSLYFAGEEASWGQHWLGYRTPKSVRKANKQGEFNLHNLARYRYWLNATPRRLMMLVTIVGGVLLPLAALRWHAAWQAARHWLYWVVPTWRLVPAAAVTVLSDLPEDLLKPGPHLAHDSYLALALYWPAQEFRELGFAMVIFLYVFSIRARLGRRPTAPAP
ncbi:MAG: hypothetical protein FJ288_05750 [Planctomycetes bacterium]|nr:hypothetical protein [Planctomycetota bacterium]